MNDFKRMFVDSYARRVAHVEEDAPKRRTFVLRLRSEPDCHPIQALRRVLKYALRQCRLRCVEVREEDVSGGGSSATRANTMTRNQCVVAALDDGLANQAAPGANKAMDMRKYLGSSFYKVDELKDRPPLQLRIADVNIGQYDRPDITFESGRKLSVNVTNNETLVVAYGYDSDAWIGHVIELFVCDGEYNGTPIKLIKVRPISRPEHYGEANKQPEPVQRKPDVPPVSSRTRGGDADMDDVIPF
jgi:hypothetical protein